MRNISRLLTSLAAVFFSYSALYAQDNKLTVELNKFEASQTEGCRAFFLFRNQAGKAFEGFEMSLAILDQEGVIN